MLRQDDPAVRRAKRQGIPVVLVDRQVTSDENYITFVTASDQALGRISAQWLAEKLGGKGKVAMLRYKAGSTSTELREAGFLRAIKEFPEIEVVSSDQEGAGYEKDKSGVLSWLSKFLNIKYNIFTEVVFVDSRTKFCG